MNCTPRLLHGLILGVPLLFLGCIKNNSGAGATNGTVLYLYDAAASDVLVWKDMDAAYAAATPPAPNLTLTNAALSRSAALAWGGLAMDTQRNHLYLLYEDGVVIRIDQVRSQTGAITSNNVVLFTLDSANRLSGSVFGQVALDPQSNILYACESGSSGTSRVWTVTQPDAKANSSIASFTTVSDDEAGTGHLGVAAAQSSVYSYFAGGNQVVSGISTYNGPRLRKGTSSAFGANFVIIGDTTGLDMSSAGTLAVDTVNSRVFVGLDTGSTSANSPTGGAPIVAFQTGQFGLSPNQKPSMWLGTLATGSIKALSHAGTKAWLVALQSSGGVGIQTILVWKAPAAGVVDQPMAMGPSTAQFRGATLDGTGS